MIRPLAFHKLQLDAHALQRRQNVGKDDGRIQIEGLERLERHLDRQIWRLDHFQNRVFFTHLAVLGHVAAGLTHEPDGCAVHGFAPAGAEESMRHGACVGCYACNQGTCVR